MSLSFVLLSCVSRNVKSVGRQIDENMKRSKQNHYERPKTKTSSYRWHDNQKKDTVDSGKTN